MRHEIFKLCADSLRTFSKEKYGIKLKAAHAHELVAAFFGYKSKNAMLGDTKHPISNLDKADIIVVISDDFIDLRRKSLKELSSELPDNYTLGEEVYAPLFADESWASQYPPFSNFKMLAKFLVENNDTYQHAFRSLHDAPMHHIVDIKDDKDYVLLTVTHAHKAYTGEMIGDGQTTINLPRVAGRVGYGKPQISVERWAGGARRTLKSMGVQQ